MPFATPFSILPPSMTRLRLRPHLVPLLLLTLCAAALLAAFAAAQRRYTGGVWGAPLDDAWIHFQFARNLARGDGFSYNPGEPTPGSTAPLWTLLLAIPALIVPDQLLLPGLALSALGLLACLWLTYGLTFDLTASRAAALTAGLATLAVGRLVWAGWSAMETTLFAALTAGVIWGYRRAGLVWWVALTAGLAAQLRPEGHALFALLGVLWLFAQRPRGRAAWRPAIGAVIVYTLTALPYVLFCLAVTGRPLPNTFYAKSSADVLFSWRALRETAQLHWADNPVAFLLLPLGIWPLWRHNRLLLLWLIGLPLLVALLVDFVWHHGRYSLPIAPLVGATAVVGWHWAVGRIPRPAVRQALWLGGAALILWGGARQLPFWAEMLGRNTAEINDIDVALGRWLAEHTAPDALIAVDDIGAIAYLSERRIFDLNGLVSPAVWPVLAEPVGLPRNTAMLRLLADVQPDYLAIFPNWHFEIAMQPLVAQPIARFTTPTHTMIAEQEALVYTLTSPYRREAQPSRPLDARFGDGIALAGVDVAITADALAVTLTWRSLQAVPVSYDVFVHLLTEDGRLIAQTDGKPLGGVAPTTRWRAGDVIVDPRVMALPADLPSGTYRLTAGLYERETFVRLPAAGTAALTADTVLLATVTR